MKKEKSKKIDIWQDVKDKQSKSSFTETSISSSKKKVFKNPFAKKITENQKFFIDENGDKILIKEKVIYKKRIKKRIKKDKSRFKSTAFILLAVLLLAILIFIPLLVIFGFTTFILDDKKLIGNELGFYEDTEFTIRHEESGMYIQAPEYKEQVLTLEEGDNSDKFTFNSNNNFGIEKSLWLYFTRPRFFFWSSFLKTDLIT